MPLWQGILRGVFETMRVLNCRSNHQRCSIKKGLLKFSQISLESTCAKASFLIKLQALGLSNL